MTSIPRVFDTFLSMLGIIDVFADNAKQLGFELLPAQVTKAFSEDELSPQLPHYDGYIIGDDSATHRVFEAGQDGGPW